MEESPYIKLLNRSSEFRVPVKERNRSCPRKWGHQRSLFIREDSKFSSLKKVLKEKKNRKFLSFWSWSSLLNVHPEASKGRGSTFVSTEMNAGRPQTMAWLRGSNVLGLVQLLCAHIWALQRLRKGRCHQHGAMLFALFSTPPLHFWDRVSLHNIGCTGTWHI